MRESEMNCYACEKAKDRPFLQFRGPRSCVGCGARELAISHGGMKPEIVDSAMHSKWPDSKTFRQGRTLFWNWVRAIEEAKK